MTGFSAVKLFFVQRNLSESSMTDLSFNILKLIETLFCHFNIKTESTTTEVTNQAVAIFPL